MKKRILSLLLVLVLLLGVLPTGVLAADGGKLSVTLSGIHDAQVKSLKLFSYVDNAKGSEISLGTAADSQYTVELEPGTYWVEGYDEKENCNGGLAITVDADHKEFKIQRIYNISVSPSSWVKDTDYTLSLKITDAGGTERTIESGVADNYGKTLPSCIFVLGDTVSATATPNAETHANYNPATASKTPTMNDSLSVTCKEFVELTITAPVGSTVDAGTLKSYFVYSFLPSVEITEENKTATFKLDKNTDYFYRVRHPEGATYWNYVRLSASAEYTVTEEDLGLSGDFNKSTIYHFENNVYDRAGIYLNINPKGYKNMAVGDTFELNSFRNWFAIESYMNAKVALPEMHYQVIDESGNTSDVVTITPNEKNSNVATMTANKAGTAIVLVTYDAMTDMAGMSSTASKRFSAIWPELTGVFVVTVDADGSAIQTNMELDRMDAEITKGEAKQLDAEHDILFYTEDDGAAYSFKPEDGCTVSVLRPTVTDTSMTYSGGFVTTGVTTAADGTVTITGLPTSRSIVKVTKNGLSTYQVITARKVSYELQDKDGKALTEEAIKALKPGDSFTIQFSNLISPKEKLSGAYNFNFSLYYEGTDGTYFKSNPGGNFGVYDFSGNPARQKLTVTIPKYWAEETYTLTGAIKQGGFAGVPSHRGITYAEGTGPKYDAPSVTGILSRLPEITLSVQKAEFLTGKLVFQDQNGASIDRKDLTITLTDAQKNTLIVKEDGTFSAYAEEYSYIITGSGVEYKTGSVTLTEGGPNEFTITLQTTSEGAWDGTTRTEPQKDDAGTTYLISNGAELAWFVNQSAKNAVSGKLTANIDLGKYPWLDISSNYKVELDGDGKAISGLNAKTGLFKQTGSNSHIQNLTVSGTITSTGSAGAITGYASGSGSVIENCVNEAAITSTGNNVGGIAGYAYNAAIRNCANKGTVTGASSVGGIIGGFVANGSTVTGCYNEGAVTATGSKAGGIFGGSGYGVTVENCYNTGKITGSTSGGIGGEAKGATHWMTGAVTAKMTVSSCYSTGEAATAAVFGTVHTASVEISKCYYLGTLTKDDNAEALSEANLKDADLSDAFGLVCNGYPALLWQSGVAFHEANGEGTVTAPTCLAKGCTTFTCSKCNASYRTTYTAALGHDFCEDTTGCDNCVRVEPTCTETGTITRTCRRTGCSVTKVDTIPAKGHTPKDGTGEAHIGYTTYVCDVCGEPYNDWTDDLLSHISYRQTGLSDISVTSSESYPWVYNTETRRFESSNAGKDSTASESSFTFTLNSPSILRFSYGASSESGYDKMTVTLTPDGGSAEKIVDAISGTTTGNFSRQLDAGSYTLTLSYNKDGGSSEGDDLGYVQSLSFAPMVRVTVENTLYKASAGAVWDGTLVDTWVELTGESTIGSSAAAALAEHDVVGIDGNYISSIDGLGQKDGSSASGWMITLNDWFIHEGLNNFGFPKYLDAGDEIRIMFSLEGGPDLGGSWNNTDTSLKSLEALGGMLTPKFSGETTTYTLTLPEGTTSVKLAPTAANKNYQVRAYLGAQETNREYRRTQPIPVADGSVLTVVCGDPSWPTMNASSNTLGKHTYTLTVQYGKVKSDDTGVLSVKVADVAAEQAEDGSFTVTVPAGTKVSAFSFAITTTDSKASVGAPTASGNVWRFTVTAEDGTQKTYTVTVTTREAKTISVTASMQAENTFMLVPQKLSVSSGLAESYGYEDALTDGVSALDVLVKVHEEIFEEAFTEETKDAYLSVSSSGWASKVAGLTDSFSFAVDGEYPCDRSGEYGQYGYTGYTITQAPVTNNGSVEFFFYQDTSYYSDYYTWFTDASGSRLDAITVTAGESFTLGLDGYMYAYGGSLTPEDRVTHGAALDPEGIQICMADAKTGELTPIDEKTVDDNGKVTLSFEQAGTYYLSAIGDAEDELYIVSPWLKVTVTRSETVHVTVTPDTVSAVVSGSTIRLVGFINDGEDIIVNGQSVKNGDTITINGRAYRIDASGVTVKPVEVTVTEEKPAAAAPENATEAETNAVERINSSPETKSEGLAEAASDKLIVDGTKEAEKVTAAEGQKVEVTARPSLEIEVLDVETTGAQTTLTLDITPTVTYTTTIKNADDETVSTTTSEKKTIDNKDIGAPVTISIPLPAGMSTENLYIKHIFSDGSGFEFIKPTFKTVNGETIVTWQQSSFSIVMLMADARFATVTIGGESKTLTPDLVNKNLPAASRDGMIFTGWTFKIGDTEFAGGPYTQLTDELLTALDTVRKNDTTVTATPSFTERPSSGSSAKTESPNKPKKDTTVDASKFVDVSRSDWFYNAVQYALENGLMNGTSASEFSPNAATTRGMIVTILARGEGVSTNNGTPWYGEGQKWAIANGISDGTNMPGVITREQLATILFRYAKRKGYDTSKSASLAAYPDAGSVSAFALEAMQWAVAEGLITGVSGRLDPQGSATRAQLATILMRFMQNIAK